MTADDVADQSILCRVPSWCSAANWFDRTLRSTYCSRSMCRADALVLERTRLRPRVVVRVRLYVLFNMRRVFAPISVLKLNSPPHSTDELPVDPSNRSISRVEPGVLPRSASART